MEFGIVGRKESKCERKKCREWKGREGKQEIGERGRLRNTRSGGRLTDRLFERDPKQQILKETDRQPERLKDRHAETL